MHHVISLHLPHFSLKKLTIYHTYVIIRIGTMGTLNLTVIIGIHSRLNQIGFLVNSNLKGQIQTLYIENERGDARGSHYKTYQLVFVVYNGSRRVLKAEICRKITSGIKIVDFYRFNIT